LAILVVTAIFWLITSRGMAHRALLMLVISATVSSFDMALLRYSFVYLAAEFTLEVIASGTRKRIGPKDWAEVRPDQLFVTRSILKFYLRATDLLGLARVPREQADDREDQER